MTAPDDNFLIEIKDKTKLVKKIVTFFIFVLTFLGFVYFLFWVVVMTDHTFANSGGKLFYPLSHLFFPNETDFVVFRKTSFVLFALILPCFIIHYLMDKFEENAIEQYALLVEKKRLEELKQEKEIKLKSYDDINEYSICFSIDFSDDINKNKKDELKNFVYTKLKEAFTNKITDVYPYVNEYLIIRSKDFEKFDYVFETFMKALSKIDKIFETKYDLEYIPSITIDAFPSAKQNKALEKEHFEIGTFNFKNRAISSMMFSKKYTFLQNVKYKGIPIGEYAYFDKIDHNSYELNVIYKNLLRSIKDVK